MKDRLFVESLEEIQCLACKDLIEMSGYDPRMAVESMDLGEADEQERLREAGERRQKRKEAKENKTEDAEDQKAKKAERAEVKLDVVQAMASKFSTYFEAGLWVFHGFSFFGISWYFFVFLIILCSSLFLNVFDVSISMSLLFIT